MTFNIQDFIGETTAYDKKAAVELQRPKSWLKSVSAFANGDGGTLLFGLQEDNTLVGIEDVQHVSEKISELIKSRLDPIPVFRLAIQQIEGKNIIILDVEKGFQSPYFYVGDGGHYAFVRVGNESVPADAQTLKRLSICGMGTTFDVLFSDENFSDYEFSVLNAKYREENGSTLTEKDFKSFSLINGSGKMSNAALLLADKPPFMQARIFCTRWNGLGKADGSVDALDDGEYSGSVLYQLSEAMAFFKRNTRVGWKKLPDKRVSLPEYPERAILEVLVNAIVHRDYMVVGSEVHLDIYDNRIEVVSPGGMYDGTRIQELDLLEVPSKRRNPLLADVFSRLDLMERKGSGFEKVLTAYRKQVNFTDELKPTYTSSATWFKAVLPNLNYSLSSSAKSNDSTRETGRRRSGETSRERILFLIANEPTITMAMIAQELGISPKGVEKHIKKLKEEKLLERKGGRAHGVWVLLEPEYKGS